MAKKETGLSKVKTDRQSPLLKFYATPTHLFNHIKINTMTYPPTFRATAAIMASLLILSACKGGARNASESDSIIEMTSTETDFGDQEIMIGRPLSMNRVGDFLLILDNKTDSLFHIVDIATPRYIGQFGTRGGGPSDFSNIILLSGIPGANDRFGILDTDKNRYYTCTLSGDLSHPYTRDEGIELKNAWFVSPLANGMYVSSKGYVDWPEIFTLYTPQGKEAGHFGDRMVPEDYRKYPPVSQTAAYQYSLEVAPDGKRVAAIGSMADAAGFYRLDGDSLKLVSQYCEYQGEQKFDPEKGDYLGVAEDCAVGIIDSASDKDHVYLLLSDLRMNDSDKGKNPWSANVVKVYDWEGNKKMEYRLDRRVRLITAPDKDGVIYAVTSEGCDPTIISFRQKN